MDLSRAGFLDRGMVMAGGVGSRDNASPSSNTIGVAARDP